MAARRALTLMALPHALLGGRSTAFLVSLWMLHPRESQASAKLARANRRVRAAADSGRRVLLVILAAAH